MYQNESLQETCDCLVLSDGHQLFHITFKAGRKVYGTSGKIKRFTKIALFLIYPI